MPSVLWLDIRHLQKVGVQEEQLLVSLVSLDQEHIEPDKERSETCAEEEECLPPPRSGEDGTERSTRTRRD